MTVNFTKIKESTDKEAAKIFQEKVLAVYAISSFLLSLTSILMLIFR